MLIELETSRFRRATKRHIRRVLKWIDPEDLKDLHAITVMDHPPDNPEYTARPRYLSGFVFNGHYEFKTKDRKARVVLFANDIYYGLPGILMHTPVATLRLARTLAHEVGHHVISTRGYIYKLWEKYKPWTGTADPYEEKIVDTYASDVIERMLKHRLYRFGAFVTRHFANLLHDAGLQKYMDGDYVRAAKLAFCAYNLDTRNLDANQCYRHAMEKLKTQTPSPLSDAERDWLMHGYDIAFATLRRTHTSQPEVKGTHKKKRKVTTH